VLSPTVADRSAAAQQTDDSTGEAAAVDLSAKTKRASGERLAAETDGTAAVPKFHWANLVGSMLPGALAVYSRAHDIEETG
jgi:hypothetical protein